LTPIAIIGGGIAGLAAAWELRQRGIQPLILEQGHRTGGVIVTEHVDGFVIDGGPDSLLIHKPAAVDLCRELGLGDRLVPTLPPRTAYVLRRGRLVSLPEASFLGLPTRIGPFVSTALFSWPGKLRMGAEVLVPPKRGDDDESIGQFIRRRFGDEAVAYLAEPLLAGIHAGDVEQLSVRSLFPRLVELERTSGSVLRGLFAQRAPRAPHGAFMSLPAGIAELPAALTAALGDGVVRYDSAVAQISGTGPFKITLTTDAALYARAVIVCVPAWCAARTLGSVDPSLAALCAQIPYASSATVAFGFSRGQVDHPLQGSGFVVPRRERGALMAATWVSSKWPNRAPDGHVLLRGFLGGATDPAMLDQGDEALAATALRELSSLLSIAGQPLLTRVFRWPRTTPQYVVGHAQRVEAIDRQLDRFAGLYLTGSAYRGTGIPDCIADARATAAKAAAFLR
jgi:oxygen-dependent protoporphyrinogen oxidase